MRYASTATLLDSARPARVRALVEALKAFDCLVRLRDRQLIFEVPADNCRWILSGGLALLFTAYRDVVVWVPSFTEAMDESNDLAMPKALPISTAREN